jgi:hypothetical protein
MVNRKTKATEVTIDGLGVAQHRVDITVGPSFHMPSKVKETQCLRHFGSTRRYPHFLSPNNSGNRESISSPYTGSGS